MDAPRPLARTRPAKERCRYDKPTQPRPYSFQPDALLALTAPPCAAASIAAERGPRAQSQTESTTSSSSQSAASSHAPSVASGGPGPQSFAEMGIDADGVLPENLYTSDRFAFNLDFAERGLSSVSTLVSSQVSRGHSFTRGPFRFAETAASHATAYGGGTCAAGLMCALVAYLRGANPYAALTVTAGVSAAGAGVGALIGARKDADDLRPRHCVDGATIELEAAASSTTPLVELRVGTPTGDLGERRMSWDRHDDATAMLPTER